MSDFDFNQQASQENMSGPIEDITPSSETAEIWGMLPNTYLMLMHLSQLLNFSGAGIIVPIMMWALNKDKYPEVDAQGKIILNWMISFFLYGIVAFALCLVFIGFFLGPILLLLGVIFPILGAVKANEGIRWKYPLSIPFFKIN